MIMATNSVAVVATRSAAAAFLQSRDNFRLDARANLPDVIEQSFGRLTSPKDGFDNLVIQAGGHRPEHMDDLALAPTLQYDVLFGANLVCRSSETEQSRRARADKVHTSHRNSGLKSSHYVVLASLRTLNQLKACK